MGSAEQFDGAWRVLREGIAAQAFPGAVAALVHRQETCVLRAEGRFTLQETSPEVTPETIYDLASLTKVIATTSMAMLLYDRGKLELDTPITQLVPEFLTGNDAERRRKVTIQNLLEHSSGLPAYVRLYEAAAGKQEVVRAACAVPLKEGVGEHTEYSDIGFIVLGVALERIAGEPLDTFASREIFAPLGMSTARFRPPAEWRDKIPPTQMDEHYRKRLIQGEVHDENASAMEGVAGHAGLFGGAGDLVRFATALLEGAKPFQRETINRFTKRASFPTGTSRALGWDTPSQPSQSGSYFGSRSFGHLGFTGSSLWVDPDRELAVVLLTNRTWPHAKSQCIKQFRPRFHDAVVECL